ncbi:MAG: Proline-rich protein [Candidatus Ozemobacter sibiricus]|uniref:Proline-rich protein n=1 Tax=Candidatus Ozemobacter sibiricus TaxID=2268124 RepID=A0A367ZQL6_9BACT|nr:MAG: Proline-rich protein [Candidatus Ozemobacter sibiricus]
MNEWAGRWARWLSLVGALWLTGGSLAWAAGLTVPPTSEPEALLVVEVTLPPSMAGAARLTFPPKAVQFVGPVVSTPEVQFVPDEMVEIHPEGGRPGTFGLKFLALPGATAATFTLTIGTEQQEGGVTFVVRQGQGGYSLIFLGVGLVFLVLGWKMWQVQKKHPALMSTRSLFMNYEALEKMRQEFFPGSQPEPPVSAGKESAPAAGSGMPSPTDRPSASGSHPSVPGSVAVPPPASSDQPALQPPATLVDQPAPAALATLVDQPALQSSPDLVAPDANKARPTLVDRPSPQPAPTLIDQPAPSPSSTLIDQPVSEVIPPIADQPTPAAGPTTAAQPGPGPIPTLVDQPALNSPPTLVDRPGVQPVATLVDQPAVQPAPTQVDQPAPAHPPSAVDQPASPSLARATVQRPSARQPAVGAPEPPPVASGGKTVARHTPVTPAGGTIAGPKSTAVAPGAIVIRLQDDRGREFSGTAREITIGRKKDNVICLSAAEVSRYHATIRADGEGFLLVPLSTSNLTTLNGERITKPVPIKAGDELGLGGTPFRVLDLRRG